MNKNTHIQIRLTNDEKQHLVNSAAAEGITVSEYLRKRAGLVKRYKRRAEAIADKPANPGKVIPGKIHPAFQNPEIIGKNNKKRS
jgi:hypothetical protein